MDLAKELVGSVVTQKLLNEDGEIDWGVAIAEAGFSAVTAGLAWKGQRSVRGVGGGSEGGNKTIFNFTPELDAHIKKIDPAVPRRRGIGGAHNGKEFFKNDVEIERETPSKIHGVKTVRYRIPKLNADGTPTGEYGARVFKKTIYGPDVISDDEFIKRGLEAANDAISKSDDGVMPREWSGRDGEGITWHGYFEDGEITSFFPEE